MVLGQVANSAADALGKGTLGSPRVAEMDQEIVTQQNLDFSYPILRPLNRLFCL